MQGLRNHPGKSGHDLTNILTLDTGLVKLANCMFYYDNKNNTGLTIKMLLLPALLHNMEQFFYSFHAII